MDNLQAEVGLSQIGVDATVSLADGAAEVYARLRTLEKDEASSSTAAAAEVAAVTAGIPMLPPPEVHLTAQVGHKDDKADAVEGSAKKDQAKELATAMMALSADLASKWADSTHSRIREDEDIRNSPAYRAQEDYLKHIKKADNPSHFSNPFTTSSMFIVGTASLGTVSMQLHTENQSTVAYNAISDSMQQVIPQIGGPGDMRAELGLIGALFATSAMLQASLLTVGGAEKSQGRSVDLQYAMAYSGRLIACCEDPAFNAYLMSLVVHHMEGSEAATPEQMKSWISMVKIGMLLSALALFYQSEKGGGVGTQVGALLKPDAEKLAPEDPRAPLINKIKEYLDVLRSSNPVLCEQVLTNIMAFIDRNKSTKSLTDSTKILLAVLSNSEGADASLQVHAATKS